MRSFTHLASRFVTLIAATSALAAVTPARAAATTVTSIYAGPVASSSACSADSAGAVPALQAAVYSDFCFALRTAHIAPDGDDLKSVIIDSPPGVLANVDQAPQCRPADFAAATSVAAQCAVNTQVGAASATIRAQVLVPGLELPLNVPGVLYNLEHTTGEAGILGIQLNPTLMGIALPKQKIVLRFTLRAAPEVALHAVASGLPRMANSGLGLTLPIAIDTFGFRFWGSKLDHPTMPVSFSRTGSGCATATTSFEGQSYGGVRSQLTRTYTPTGCARLAIQQSATVRTAERRPDVPTETTVEVRPGRPADPDRNATVNPAAAVVTLPPGLMLGAQGASGSDGLPLCSNEQFSWRSNAKPTCPAASATAEVTFVSPNLKVPFIGKAYLGEQTGPNRLPQLMISADQGGRTPDAPRIKLLGQLTIDAQGRLVTTLTGLPDVPFDSFLLTFRGGEHGVTSTPTACGTGVGSSVLSAPSASSAASTVALPLTIDRDCVDPAAFAPTLDAQFAATGAGGQGNPTFTITRADRTARLGRATIHLPAGMLASLKGVTECPATAAATGACPEASRVGVVTTIAGVGPAPATTPRGTVFLTERPEGAVAALTIVAPVAFGGVDLGTLVVPGRIDLRPDALGLDLTTNVPATYLDIPLNLRSMAVTLDRPGFSRNPTSCAPLAVSAELRSTLGAVSTPTAAVQMTGCDTLPFTPTVSASLPANTKRGDAPGMTTVVGTPGLQSALKRVTVTLPDGVGADLSKLARACPVLDFRAGRCGDAAVTGTATGHLAILDEPVGGRVLLVKFPGEAMPGIGLALVGRFSARIEGHVTVAPSGRLVVTLDGLPDAPIDDLAMTFTPGAPSALKVSDAFCPTGTTSFEFALVGQSGASANRTVTQPCSSGGVLAARARRATVRATLTGRRTAAPALRLNVTAPAGTLLAGADVTLGAGLSVPAGGPHKISVAEGRVRVSGRRTIRVALRGTGRRTIALRLQNGTLGSTASVRRSTRRISIRLTLRYADGVAEQRTVRVG